MDWWIWVIVAGASIMLVIDWFIVMGFNPKHWKGGGKNGNKTR